MEQIIKSLLDTDFYKFNMNQVIFHKHTNLNGEYHFKCRTADAVFTQEIVDEINHQIDLLCKLKFTNEELEYLRSIRFIKDDYVEFLRLWHPIRDYVDAHLEGDKLVCVVTGPCFSAMQFEIYLLEIINEVYFRMTYNYDELYASAMERLQAKCEKLANNYYTFKFAEFGCRRRLSREFQEVAVMEMAKTGKCVGTSNVYLAMKYHLTPIGTYAHEYVQMYQGISTIPVAMTNKVALQEWFSEYNGDNGTALTDTLGTDIFLKDFDYLQSLCYKGVRHDSGDPYAWGEKMIKHYESLGIDPKTKTLLFSDSLDFDKAQALYDYFKDRINVTFGIGTYCSNDTKVRALNIVLKLQRVNGRPVAKISDSEGKTMCLDEGYVEYLKSAIKRRLADEK